MPGKESKKPAKSRQRSLFWRKIAKKTEKFNQKSAEHVRKNFFGRLASARNVRLLVLEWVATIFVCLLLSGVQAVWFREAYTTTTFSSGGTFVEGTLGDVNSLNPLFATTSSEKTLSGLMFEGLTRVDSSGKIGLGLASSLKSSDDAKTWTITLKDNLKWSDGEPLTLDDVLFTAALLQDPSKNTNFSTNLSGVTVEKTGDSEISFILKNPYVDFASALTFPILPRHAFLTNSDDYDIAVDKINLEESQFNSNPITSGAFTFNAVQTSGAQKTIYLDQNENYYRGAPLIDTFVLKTFTSEDEVVAALNAGEITGSPEITGERLSAVSSNLETTSANLSGGAFLFINTTGTLSSREARAALREGLDLQKIRAIAKNTTPLDFPLLENQIKLENYPIIPEYNFSAAKETLAKIYNLNPSAATENFTNSETGDTTADPQITASSENSTTLSLVTVNSGYLPAVGSELKSELEALGFTVNLTVYEENQDFLRNIISPRAYDLLLYEVDLGATPDLLPYYHSSGAESSGLNLSNYKNSSVDDLLLTARETTDESFRQKKYESFLNYFVRDVPAIGLYQSRLSYIHSSSTKVFNPDTETLVSSLDRLNSVRLWSANLSLKNRTP